MAGSNGKDLYNYLADSGDTHIVRLDDVTLTLNINGTTQTQPPGPATSEFWAQASRGATEYGLRPRKVKLCFTEDPVDTTLEQGSTYEVTVLDPAQFALVAVNGTIEYQGYAAKVTGKVGESIYPGI